MSVDREVSEEIARWFADPLACVSESARFAGVVVFAHPLTGARRALAADELDEAAWRRRGVDMTMPASAQPRGWKGARAVGFAATLVDALNLMEAPSVPPPR